MASSEAVLAFSNSLAYILGSSIFLSFFGLLLLFILKSLTKTDLNLSFRISKKTFQGLEKKPFIISVLVTWLMLNLFGLLFGGLAPQPTSFALFLGGALALYFAKEKRLLYAALAPYPAALLKFLANYSLALKLPLALDSLIIISFNTLLISLVAGSMGGLYALFFLKKRHGTGFDKAGERR